MDYKATATSIVKAVGGPSNIKALTHCATRLRFTLHNEDEADDAAIERLPGISGVSHRAGQFQVIVGPEVSTLFATMRDMGLADGMGAGGHPQGTKKSYIGIAMDAIAGIFTPVLMPIIAAGMIKAFLAVLLLLKVVSNTDDLYVVLTFISDATFYFLPVLLGFSSAKKFGANPYLGAMLGAVLIHPTFTAMVSAGEARQIIGISIPLVSYSSSVIPVILSVWVMSYIQRLATKIVPSVLKVLGIPLLTMLISAPLMLLFIAPLGDYLGQGLALVVETIQGYAPWLIPLLFGAFNPLLVMMGMHYAFLPISTQQMAAGKEYLMGAPSLCSNMSVAASTLCVALKSKDHIMRQTAASAGFTALMGITEPAMFGVQLKLKRPLVCAMIAGAIGGFYVGMTGVYRIAFGATGLATLGVFITEDPMNLINAVAGAGISMVISFALTWFFGFSDHGGEAEERQSSKLPISNGVESEELSYPMVAKVEPLESIADPVFSSGALGRGVALRPAEGVVCAPADGTIMAVFPTKHAIGMLTDKGSEIMIHVGIDTVKLNGRYFEAKVSDHQHVRKGEQLVLFDVDKISAAGYDLTTPIIITNLSEHDDIEIPMEKSDVLFTVRRGAR